MSVEQHGYYDLADAKHYEAFANKYGERFAKAMRFGLAYGMLGNRAVSMATVHPQKCNDLTSAEVLKLKAAFGTKGGKA